MKRHRRTVPVGTDILPAMRDRLKADAERGGYPSVKAYLERLIVQGIVDVEPDEAKKPDEQTQGLAAAYPSAAWAFGPTILMHRVVRGLDDVHERMRAGEDVGTLERDFTELRREISEHLLALRKDYDREVETRDRRHYGRLGGVE
jgi:hypothetical protein